MIRKIIKEFSRGVKTALQDNVILIKLFGSEARGDAKEESDIDVLIVLKRRDFVSSDKIYKVLFGLDPYYKYKISLSIFSQEEYKKNEEIESFFIENINKEAILL